MFTKYVTWGEMKQAAEKQGVPDDEPIVFFDCGLTLSWGELKAIAEKHGDPDDLPLLAFDMEDYAVEGSSVEFVF